MGETSCITTKGRYEGGGSAAAHTFTQRIYVDAAWWVCGFAALQKLLARDVWTLGGDNDARARGCVASPLLAHSARAVGAQRGIAVALARREVAPWVCSRQ
jgi:hypothetical protein